MKAHSTTIIMRSGFGGPNDTVACSSAACKENFMDVFCGDLNTCAVRKGDGSQAGGNPPKISGSKMSLIFVHIGDPPAVRAPPTYKRRSRSFGNRLATCLKLQYYLTQQVKNINERSGTTEWWGARAKDSIVSKESQSTDTVRTSTQTLINSSWIMTSVIIDVKNRNAEGEKWSKRNVELRKNMPTITNYLSVFVHNCLKRQDTKMARIFSTIEPIMVSAP